MARKEQPDQRKSRVKGVCKMKILHLQTPFRKLPVGQLPKAAFYIGPYLIFIPFKSSFKILSAASQSICRIASSSSPILFCSKI